MKKKILVCVGTRPNFIKVSQLRKAFSVFPEIEYKLLHTGQHYDAKMTDVFFNELKIGAPDFRLQIPQGTSVQRMMGMMIAFDTFLDSYHPDLIMVPGDVDSSFACAFIASRRNISVAHIESGLRSFDMSMPEEVNRILIDEISELLLVSEPSGMKNLIQEGKAEQKIKYVGNTMIDSLVAFTPLIDQSKIRSILNLTEKYIVVTLHRPSNVDDMDKLKTIAGVLKRIASGCTVVFPAHPRTIQNLKKFGIENDFSSSNIKCIEPLGYIDFLHLVKNSNGLLTDSGGVQEETTFLGVPCLTLRNNTERPVTVDEGTNELISLNDQMIVSKINSMLDGTYKKGNVPKLWDGKTSERIASEVSAWLKNNSKIKKT